MSFSASEITAWVGGRIVNSTELGDRLGAIRVERPSELAESGPSDLAFFFSKNYQKDLLAAAPGVLITGEPFVGPLEASGLPLWKRSAIIACRDPYLGMALALEKMAEKLSSVTLAKSTKTEIHPSAVVDPSVELGAGVVIGAGCVVEEGARIGARTKLYPGCFVGPKAKIGEDCILFPRVTLYEWTEIGSRTRIHAGTVIGADGFGYAPVRDGENVVDHRKIYHLGKVVVGDDVEIGANTCIDRGTIGVTKIGNKAKIDNQVQIGHNCVIDEGAVICGTTGLSGRASVGKFAYVLGAVGVINDVHIGERSLVGGMTLVSKDVPPGTKAAGNPMREYQEHFKLQAILNRMLKERKK